MASMTSRTFSSRRVCINTFPCVMAALWAIVSVSVCDAAALSVRASSTRVQLHSGMLPLADAVITEALRAMREKDTVASADPFPSPMYVTQPQDHFDASNVNTWQQAYYVNDKYWKGASSNAPVFVCVGGEGPPLDGSAVVSSVHCNNAVEWLPETGALMLALEHRYYGCHNQSACPVANFSGPARSSLRFLSSRQALADLAHFHSAMVKQYGLTPANKWVSWGGSYPGMLAGWFRLKYPNLIHASVASSAPVQAKLDMQGYNDVTAEAYSVADNNVGGSPPCTAAIAEGHASIKTMFGTSAGRARLASLFHNTPAWYEDPSNQAEFAGGGVAYFPAQGNDPSCTEPGCNIKMICSVMTNTSIGDPVDRLAALRNGQQSWLGSAGPGRLSLRSRSKSGDADYWGWQTCTEFGFYQTCEVGSKCFYAQGYVTLASMDSFCQAEFGITQNETAAFIDDTNAWYGGDKPAGSCVIYPNGEVDPWHSLSVLKAPGNGIEVMMVPGASHHAWTHPSAPTDQPSVVAAKTQIRAVVTRFLASGCEQPNATAV